MQKINNILLVMISMRILSGLLELTAAFLMYHFKSIETAIRINAILGLAGPIVLILVTFVGLARLSNQLNLKSLILISIGIILILMGTR